MKNKKYLLFLIVRSSFFLLLTHCSFRFLFPNYEVKVIEKILRYWASVLSWARMFFFFVAQQSFPSLIFPIRALSLGKTFLLGPCHLHMSCRENPQVLRASVMETCTMRFCTVNRKIFLLAFFYIFNVWPDNRVHST